MPERERIADLRREGASLRAIGRTLGRSASTVGRELDARSSADGRYRPHEAQRAWAASRARPKATKLATPGRLRTDAQDKPNLRWSPPQIAAVLVDDFPGDEAMRVSHETIYQAFYVQACGGLKPEVAAALRTGRTRREPHRPPGQRTPRFVDEMVMISDRPTEVEDRAVPGIGKETRSWARAASPRCADPADRVPAGAPAGAADLGPGL
ncbi:putative transposase [Mobilicoccus pelagius NBRC 104925]|uniref:Putative transposase n=1 Tax=Mobilicoccus pelagius NBRC 104925 TaxID=1089455 RepID=H5UT46_9MICO|nr:putative transposase [Mobilicoccus pelagius NBRC 104925]